MKRKRFRLQFPGPNFTTKNYSGLKILGSAYGVVISALDESSGQKVAIKKARKHLRIWLTRNAF